MERLGWETSASALLLSSEGMRAEVCPACRLILVDAHALLYRSHYGFRTQRLETAGGEDTSISYGFLSTVLRLLEIQEPPTHFAVVMDHHGKTFR